MRSDETKADAFRRLATQRTNAVLEKLRILGHCANPQLYEYSDEDVKKIFKAIRDQLKEMEQKFTDRKHSEFKL